MLWFALKTDMLHIFKKLFLTNCTQEVYRFRLLLTLKNSLSLFYYLIFSRQHEMTQHISFYLI